jgi:hypothetical protein
MMPLLKLLLHSMLNYEDGKTDSAGKQTSSGYPLFPVAFLFQDIQWRNEGIESLHIPPIAPVRISTRIHDRDLVPFLVLA